MGWRSTAALALSILAVGAYVWFDQATPDTSGDAASFLGESRPNPPRKPVEHLLTFEPADVVGVQLEHDTQTRSAERVQGQWRGATSPGAVNDFLHNLAQLGVVMDIPAAPSELSDYGLQPPRSIARLRLQNHAEPLTLLIGDRNPATTGVYVRLGTDGRIVLAGALLEWEFEKAFKALQPAGAGDRNGAG